MMPKGPSLVTYAKLLTFSFTLYKSMVRSHLDYCSSVWNPYHKGDIEALEKVQKQATKILPELKHLSYCDRLRSCNLTTLHYRRIRGDRAYDRNIQDSHGKI